MTDHLFLMGLRQAAKTSEPETATALDQQETERIVRKAFVERLSQCKTTALELSKDAHLSYLQHLLLSLPASFDCLDASQCWMAYWISHSLSLLNAPVKENHKKALISLLKSCQAKTGGFGGGPYQVSHLATTYGAVNCLCLLGGSEALSVIDRASLYHWLYSLRRGGAFCMHTGGEVDVRGAYCAVAVASLVNLETDELFAGTPEWITTCQTYEGGFGGAPGLEAHGGYSFCAFAALFLLKKWHLIDIDRLLYWAACRQMALEGGFQGRTNKLVDSCYSFWMAGLFPLLHQALSAAPNGGDPALPVSEWLFHATALQEYILICCQRHNGGGLMDKPGKSTDPYHTCYALSGLSLAQHFTPTPQITYKTVLRGDGEEEEESNKNELEVIDPAHNVVRMAVEFSQSYFRQKGVYHPS